MAQKLRIGQRQLQRQLQHQSGAMGSLLGSNSGDKLGVCSGGTQVGGSRQCSITASPANRLTWKGAQRVMEV